MPDQPPPTPQYATPGGYIPFATPAPPRRSFGKGLFGWVLFVGLAIMLFVLLRREAGPAYELSLSDFTTELTNHNLKTIHIEGDEISGQFIRSPTYANGITQYRASVPTGIAGQWSFIQWVLDNRGIAKVTVNNDNNLILQFVMPLIPWLLIFGFVWFFIFRQLRKKASQPATPTP